MRLLASVALLLGTAAFAGVGPEASEGDPQPESQLVIEPPAPPPEASQPIVIPLQQPAAPIPAAPAPAAPTAAPSLAPKNVPDASNPAKPTGPGYVDGHKRYGSFLSGPGSLGFIIHHTLLGGAGILATQMVPRIYNYATCPTPGTCADWIAPDARIAYLVGAIVGAAVGFGGSAWFQFYNWVSEPVAGFSGMNSVLGGLLFAGISSLSSRDPNAIAWMTLLGAEMAAWATTILGSPEFPISKGVLMASGGFWALYFTSMILAIVATTGGGAAWDTGLKVGMLAPGLGAGLMALAGLKWNPSIERILRVDAVGAGAGAAVLLLSALVLGARFDLPTPYILGGVTSVAAMSIVALLWADDSEDPAAAAVSSAMTQERLPPRRGTFWWW